MLEKGHTEELLLDHHEKKHTSFQLFTHCDLLHASRYARTYHTVTNSIYSKRAYVTLYSCRSFSPLQNVTVSLLSFLLLINYLPYPILGIQFMVNCYPH